MNKGNSHLGALEGTFRKPKTKNCKINQKEKRKPSRKRKIKQCDLCEYPRMNYHDNFL